MIWFFSSKNFVIPYFFCVSSQIFFLSFAVYVCVCIRLKFASLFFFFIEINSRIYCVHNILFALRESIGKEAIPSIFCLAFCLFFAGNPILFSCCCRCCVLCTVHTIEKRDRSCFFGCFAPIHIFRSISIRLLSHTTIFGCTTIAYIS